MTTFALQLKEFADKAKANADLVVRKVVLDMGTRIVMRSPVGDPELWASNAHNLAKQAEHAVRMNKNGTPSTRRWNRAALEKAYPIRKPKGYVGGHFRANWQYGNFGETAVITASNINEVDPSGQMSIANLLSRLPSQGAAGMRHVVMNNLPYCQRLEDGWSKQAPYGMVAVTVREFQGIVRSAADSVNKAGGVSVASSNRTPNVFGSGRRT